MSPSMIKRNGLALLGALAFATLHVSGADEAIQKTLYFESDIQINQDPGIVRVMVSDEEMVRLLNTTQFVVYPGSFLINGFYLANETDDTLELAPDGQSMLQFLKFKYAYRGDSASPLADMPFKYVELKISYPDTILPTWGRGSKLPPHAIVNLDASVGWDDLVKLDARIVDFRWIYDNSSAAQIDTTITLARYTGPIKGIKIMKIPETRGDSLYYFSLQAKRLNGAQRFDEALNYGNMILQMDSSNYAAIETMADVLWKLSRFDEALIYALKGKALLESAANALRDQGMLVTSDDAGQFIDRMNFFIDKCQRREKWKWSK